MRALHRWSALSLLAASIVAAGASACTAEAEDDVEDGTQDITGGSRSVASPTVYFFEAKNGASPKCVGALLSDRIAVTAKSCAATNMLVGRAKDADDRARSTVRKIDVPDAADADIAIVELDRPLPGTNAVITHAPLRDGYTVNGAATFTSMFGADRGTPSSLKARLVSETETQSLLTTKGGQICMADIGAPVCSSSSVKVGGREIGGTCGLAGIVVAPPDLAPVPTVDGGAPSAGAPPTMPVYAGRCVPGAWKVAPLGRYADFIKRFAPEAFEPIVVRGGIFSGETKATPDGLWGFRSGGELRSCTIETTQLAPAMVNGETPLRARVTFGNMQERSTPFGRFGIAPRSAPTQMRWLAAQGRLLGGSRSTTIEASFDGVVTADKDGDYVVAFRASANGGETWTQCDLDGIQNGFSADKALALKVGVGDPASVPTTTPAPATTEPTSTPPASVSDPSSTTDPFSSSSSSDSDPSSSSDPSTEPTADGDGKKETKKKKKSDGGCSTTPGAGAPSSLSVLGVLVAIVAMLRRRRANGA